MIGLNPSSPSDKLFACPELETITAEIGNIRLVNATYLLLIAGTIGTESMDLVIGYTFPASSRAYSHPASDGVAHPHVLPSGAITVPYSVLHVQSVLEPVVLDMLQQRMS